MGSSPGTLALPKSFSSIDGTDFLSYVLKTPWIVTFEAQQIFQSRTISWFHQGAEFEHTSKTLV